MIFSTIGEEKAAGMGRSKGTGADSGVPVIEGRRLAEIGVAALGVGVALLAIAPGGPAARGAENAGAEVVFEWDSNPEPDVAGYRIYWGSEPRRSSAYPNVIDIPGAGSTTGEIRGLTPGATYFTALTAYNTAGFESDFTAEIEFVVDSAANEAPVITLRVAGGTSEFNEGETIPLIAEASDPDGEIASVSFRAGELLIGADLEAPYQLSWEGVAAGSYSVRATAVDSSGASAVSEPVAISVILPAPKIANVSPASEGEGDGLTFKLSGPPGGRVRLEWSDDHLTWNLLREKTLNDSGNTWITDLTPLTPGGKPRFYRVR